MSIHGIDGIVLVTGGGSGIGQHTAYSFAEAGAQAIVVADINEPSAQVTVEACKTRAIHKGFQSLAMKVDVIDAASVQAMVDKAVETFGRIDYCVHSAGTGSDSLLPIADSSVEEFAKVTTTNMTGTFLVNRAVSKAMQVQEPRTFQGRHGSRSIGRGAIVNLASGSSFVAVPGKVPYNTSKHAVVGITKTAAVDNARNGIRVNAVAPSWVEGPMIAHERSVNPRLDGIIKAIVPLGGRPAEPDEVSETILYLCSPIASYVTGQTLLVDGGVTLSNRPN